MIGVRTWANFQEEVIIGLPEATGAITEVCGPSEVQRVRAAEERTQR